MDLERLLESLRRRKDPLLALAILVGSALLFRVLVGVLVPFLIALVIAYVLEPLLVWLGRVRLGRVRLSRMTCVLITYILGAGLMMMVGLPLVVNVATGMVRIAQGVETADLQVQATRMVRGIQDRLHSLPLPEDLSERVRSLVSDPVEVSRLVATVFQKLRDALSTVLRGGAGMLTTAVSASMQLMLVPVLLFYFMLEFPGLSEGFLLLVPPAYHGWMRGFLARVDRTLGGFVRGQLLIAFLFGAVMTLGLMAIGIPFAVVLGPMSGIANLVPYLGVVVGLVPAFFLALWQGGLGIEGLMSCGAIALLFVVLQLLDGYLFQPRILGPSVELHPLWIMLSLAIGEHWMGLPGMMLAVPVAAVLRVILSDLHSAVFGSDDPVPDPAPTPAPTPAPMPAPAPEAGRPGAGRGGGTGGRPPGDQGKRRRKR